MFGLPPLGNWFSREPSATATDGLQLSAEDVAELTRIGHDIAAEYVLSSPAVLSANLARLLARRVPVRSVAGGSIPRVGGLHFADGTVVLVKGMRTGDLGRVATRALLHQVTLEGFHCTNDGVVLDLLAAGHPVSLMAVSLDPTG